VRSWRARAGFAFARALLASSKHPAISYTSAESSKRPTVARTWATPITARPGSSDVPEGSERRSSPAGSSPRRPEIAAESLFHRVPMGRLMVISAEQFFAYLPRLLSTNEKVLETWRIGRSYSKFKISPGLLVLTDQRVLFFEARKYKKLGGELIDFDEAAPPSVNFPLRDCYATTTEDGVNAYVRISSRSVVASFIAGGSTVERHNRVSLMANRIRDEIQRSSSSKGSRAAADERRPPPSRPEPRVVVQREVITREVVKIPCKYCSTLNVITDAKCSSCGANIK
jgi:hypothetical protein